MAPADSAPRRPRPALRRALLCLLGLATTACSSAVAAPAVSQPAQAFVSHPAVAILHRLESASAVPDVTGLPVENASRRLAALGVEAQVVAFQADTTVSAQYPEAGAPLPADRLVVVWVGTPPAPPPPPPPPPPERQVAAAPAPPQAAAAEAPHPAPAADVSPVAPQPAGPQGPTPRRTSPRNLPATEPGTVLAGRASWYGPGFAGLTTACGGAFDPAQLTLASRELRCGTRVRVTGPSGASVEATVTDWGPAEWTGRRFDLSQATFAAIHHPGAGVVSVSVEVLGS